MVGFNEIKEKRFIKSKIQSKFIYLSYLYSTLKDLKRFLL